MEHSSSMPFTESITLPILSTTTTTRTQVVEEMKKIADITTDDESNKLAAPSVQVRGKNNDKSSNSSELFDVPIDYLQQPEQLLNNTATEPCSTTIYRISAQQYNDLQAIYVKHPLPPDSLLFPWLHGVNGTNYQECLFFGVRRMVVPKHRGLVLVHANGSSNQVVSERSRLVQSFLPEDILMAVHPSDNEEETWGFRDNTTVSSSSGGIHLRNFKIQPYRYASISDIVIYGDQAETIARRVSQAQHRIYQERQVHHQRLRQSSGKRAIVDCNDITYRILIIRDTIDTFEKYFPELVWYNSNGHLMNNVSFLEREKREMREMSGAQELTDNIWFGNTYDAPASIDRDDYSDEMIEEDDIVPTTDDYHDHHQNDDNPNRYSVCIECHDLSDMPLRSILTLARETLNELGQDEVPSEVVHLDMYSTGAVIESTEQLDTFLEHLIQLLEFMDDISCDGRRILVHCADGYTETSILALTWLMYKNNLSLPAAYLYLQKQRSFFVVSSDIPFLRRIEQHILLLEHHRSGHQHQKRKRDEMAGFELTTTLPSLQLYDDTNTSTSDPPHHKVPVRSLHDDQYLNSISNRHHHSIDNTRMNEEDIDETIIIKLNQDNNKQHHPVTLSTMAPPPEQMIDYPWFFSPRFEGSFPSRILPYVYLGNLNHATNPTMLKALGITHIVSVGENANLDPQHFKLFYLDNLYDDGIDSIRNRCDEAMAFIDEAFNQKTKCLVHCRVGVSRSAAITICYVMHHFRIMSLVDAYIFVRARRLNVIIQPNLKFMYEMLQLEQTLFGKTLLTWPVLCHQINLLNEAYDED
ncbi:hypothetical protein BC941DRAFT_444458 [Chlamydoabsidia padenii]|nr:hypothetical protein BC941DRAFT_444458 [Chlamydoabsidia padenii]